VLHYRNAKNEVSSGDNRSFPFQSRRKAVAMPDRIGLFIWLHNLNLEDCPMSLAFMVVEWRGSHHPVVCSPPRLMRTRMIRARTPINSGGITTLSIKQARGDIEVWCRKELLSPRTVLSGQRPVKQSASRYCSHGGQ
jgi:hypothetical protein